MLNHNHEFPNISFHSEDTGVVPQILGKDTFLHKDSSIEIIHNSIENHLKDSIKLQMLPKDNYIDLS